MAQIQRILQDVMIDGIEYHKIGDSAYEMRLFEDSESLLSGEILP